MALTLISAILLLGINIYADFPPSFFAEPQPSYTISPKVVNKATYTNLTIVFKNNININNTDINIINATILFKKIYNNIINIGIYPTGDEIIVLINNTENILNVANICTIKYTNSYNFTTSIFINVSSTCSNLREYLNGTYVPMGSVYTPSYSGLYNILLTNESYYINLTYVVSPAISTNTVYYGQALNISLNPPLHSPGTASIGGVSLPVTSSISLPPYALAAGNYTLMISQDGVQLLSASVEVLPAAPNITIDLNNSITYGTNNKYTINTYLFNNYYKSNIGIFINGSLIATGTTPLSLYLPLLDVGTYNFTVVAYATANTTQSSAARLIKVLPAPVSLKVYVNGSPLGQIVLASYGQILVFNASARSTLRPTGKIVVSVDGRSFGDVVDTLTLGAGLHNATVTFIPSSRNFMEASVSTAIVVAKSVPELSVPRYVAAVYGEIPNVTLGLYVYGRPVSGVLDIAVGNYTGAVQVFGSTSVRLPALPAGSYVVYVSFPGNGDLYPASATFQLVVRSAGVVLSVAAPQRAVYGASVPISASISPQVPGRISIYVNNTLIYSGQGPQIKTTWRPPRSGVFNITAYFLSFSGNYSNAVSTTIIYVEKARCTINISLNSSVIYVLRKYEILINSSVVPAIYLDGRYLGESLALPLSFNYTGLHTIFAVFRGDARYYQCNSSAAVYVLKNPSQVAIEIPRKLAVPNSPIDIYLTILTKSNIVNGTIYIYVINLNNGNNYTFTKYINSGRETVEISLPNPGSYEIKAYYGGNPYVAGNSSNAIAVSVVESLFGIPVMIVLGYGVAAASAYAAVVAIKLKRRRYGAS
jgi:hypothetical protein